MRLRAFVLCLAAAACGGGDDAPATPDAGIGVDASPDAPVFAACAEFATGALSLPAHVSGMLAAADLVSPMQCAAVDAPYGIASAGPDSVVALTGLVPGSAYIVQLRSLADLAFYVVSGCSTQTGPAQAECALFVDASAGNEEVGRFVADATTAYVVVDYYASATPTNQRFVLDVYAEACQADADCANGPPVCDHGRCVECADSFDCADASTPRCNATTNSCVAGDTSCTADTASEPMDDGPSGAVALVADGAGLATAAGQVCSTPGGEADYYSLAVGTGESWDLALAWTGTRDLDLELLDATGASFGLSFWEQPEAIRSSFLPAGTYYVRVTDFSPATASPVDYTLTAQRTSTTGCTNAGDCAAEFRNQVFRGQCSAGACIAITETDVAVGGACDTEDDCAANLACPDFYFVADADTRTVCSTHCTGDADCAAMGTDYVCTTYLATGNFCVQKCTTDDHCPTDPTSQPVSGPWYRLSCQTATGRCVF